MTGERSTFTLSISAAASIPLPDRSLNQQEAVPSPYPGTIPLGLRPLYNHSILLLMVAC